MVGDVDWKGKLSIGEKWEELAIKKLSPTYGDLSKVEGKFKPYDLFNDSVKLEVKGEVKSVYSGNVCFEYRFKKKLSGIASTKADRWVHFYFINGWKMTDAPVDELRAWLKDKKFKKVVGGDYDASELILVPCYKFHNRFGSVPV